MATGCPATCGDGSCGTGEDSCSCPADCPLDENATISAWSIDGHLASPVGFFGVVTAADDIFHYGGLDESGTQKAESFLYHPGGSPMPTASVPMPDGRHVLGFVQHNGRAYAVGGHGPGGNASRHADVWSIDPLVDSAWATEPSLAPARDSARCASVGTCIYVVGGHTESPRTNLDTLERLCDGSGTWETLASMSHRRANPGVAAVGGKIYAFGGQDVGVFHQSLEISDPTSDTRLFGPDMITPLS